LVRILLLQRLGGQPQAKEKAWFRAKDYNSEKSYIAVFWQTGIGRNNAHPRAEVVGADIGKALHKTPSPRARGKILLD